MFTRTPRRGGGLLTCTSTLLPGTGPWGRLVKRLHVADGPHPALHDVRVNSGELLRDEPARLVRRGQRRLASGRGEVRVERARDGEPLGVKGQAGRRRSRDVDDLAGERGRVSRRCGEVRISRNSRQGRHLSSARKRVSVSPADNAGSPGATSGVSPAGCTSSSSMTSSTTISSGFCAGAGAALAPASWRYTTSNLTCRWALNHQRGRSVLRRVRRVRRARRARRGGEPSVPLCTSCRKKGLRRRSACVSPCCRSCSASHGIGICPAARAPSRVSGGRGSRGADDDAPARA